MEVAQFPFIDKVVVFFVGAETDLERLFRQSCVSHVRRGSLRGSSSGCCYVQPALVMEYVAPARSKLCRLSTVAVLGKVVHMPFVVSSTGVNGLDSAEYRRVSRGVSIGAQGPDCAETRGDSTGSAVAVHGQIRRHSCRRCATTGAHGPDCAEDHGGSTGAFLG